MAAAAVSEGGVVRRLVNQGWDHVTLDGRKKGGKEAGRRMVNGVGMG